jgi:hypothetical protein
MITLTRTLLASLAIALTAPAAALAASPSPSADPYAADPSRLRFEVDEWATDFTRASVPLGSITSGGPPKDGIPPVDRPVFESIAAARDWLPGRSPVIALEVEGQARAYPLAILIWHEIVNDTLGGVPVVVTFCPLCNTALVFDRTLDGVLYDFGTTGKLRLSDLVMWDRQTQSWWQQATGEAIVGELTGAKLDFRAAQIVSLDDFAATWPDGEVLSRDTGNPRPYGRNPYPGYDEPNERPFLFEGSLNGRLAPKERVVAVDIAGDRIAFPWTTLQEVGLAAETVGGEPIVVFWQAGTVSALDQALLDESADVGATGVFLPRLDDRTLTFERPDGPTGPILDVETGSTWSVTGHAIDGPLAGSRLEPVVHGNHFWFAWSAFAVGPRIWEP